MSSFRVTFFQPGRFSQKGLLGLASSHVTLKGIIFSLYFYLFFEYKTIGLSLEYSERDTSSVASSLKRLPLELPKTF